MINIFHTVGRLAFVPPRAIGNNLDAYGVWVSLRRLDRDRNDRETIRQSIAQIPVNENRHVSIVRNSIEHCFIITDRQQLQAEYR